MAAAAKVRGKRLSTALAAAVAHPIRTRSLAILGERVASPAEIARELQLDVSKVGHHVNVLADADLIEEVGSRPVRGAVEHYYAAKEFAFISDEQEAELPLEDRRTFAESILALYVGNAASALDAGTLVARTNHHLTRTSGDLDEQGFSDAAEAYWALYLRMEEVEKEAAGRLKASGEEPVRTISFLSLFEAPDATKSAE
jgi:DNA-binding transcriptional ArsR family regulator